MTTENIFDPRLYADVRRPLPEARTLPRWCYLSDVFHQREIDRIFLKTWNFIDRIDAVPNPGDYIAVDTFAGPVIVLRDRGRTLRAFANTCRHRGSRLLVGTGNCRGIVCPYHSWTYGLDGALLGAKGMERTAGFDRSRYGLKPIRLETWGGFMFINFDAHAEGLLEYLGELPRKFASYKFDDMVCTRRSEYEIACNWKLIIENAHEDYHTQTVHRTSLGNQVTEPEASPVGNWDALFLPLETSVAVLPGEPAPFPHIPALEGKLAHGTYFTLLHPATQFACVQDCMWWLRVTPLGPTACRLNVGFCFPKTTAARPDFAQEVEAYYRRWDIGIAEDNSTGTLQQAGLRSPFYEPGPLSWKEPKVQSIALWILDRVLDDPATLSSRAAE
jgi:phenylpropionate dioxygenase-like ring-hydroxylating dioxygenase large terminal subunit